MDHFSIYELADFARQVNTAQQAAVQQHLNEGCAECQTTLNMWRHLVNFATRERSCEPPAWAVRAVNAGFAVNRMDSKPGPLEIAKLIFDSALQPVAEGLRGTAAVARQLLFKSGSVCIDMRMQPKPGSGSVVLIGQLLDSAKPDHGISGIPVRLLSRGGTVSHRKTNDVGEFDFGIAALGPMQLIFRISKGRNIVVPVPDGDSSG